MNPGDFQRYVWVKGERKRQINREKYEETRKRYLDCEVDDIDPPKKPNVVWPGEFENQLKKRNRNLEKIDERGNGIGTPAIHTPSDTQSIISKYYTTVELFFKCFNLQQFSLKF
ncbi:Protein CBG14095 [Caenorhabditis briggsae]|uniref:Protein CBG14095 n=1 Tax=Caenorhabditis briggsae TaxID=6238 RepID=A8XJB7_CAEBR|nr:Protein CBG14095 [Caenorhabditis briggsae]CAP32742.2 Protein CBG14095 [Caenorhabditis briggsae]